MKPRRQTNTRTAIAAIKMLQKLEFLAIMFLACGALVQSFVNNPSILWDSKNPM